MNLKSVSQGADAVFDAGVLAGKRVFEAVKKFCVRAHSAIGRGLLRVE